MGIVAQAARVGAVAIAPGGYLHAGVPFIKLPFLRRGATTEGLLRPMAQAELGARGQQRILQQEHAQEAVGIAAEALDVEGFVVGNGVLILHASLVGQRLTDDVHEVVLQVVVQGGEGLSPFQEELGGTECRLRVVVVLHLRPAAGLEVVQRGPSAEDALVRALLVVARRAVVDALSQQLPCLLQGGVVSSIAGLHIVAQPLLLGELLGSPGQLAHQLEHHGVVLRPLHGEADALS